MPLSASEYRQLRQIYQFRCGYCGVSEVEVGAELTIDHFHPRSRQGPDTLENSVYCCHACNSFKGAHWNPHGALRILHPLRDNLSAHIETLSDHTLQGLTEAGQFHIQRLHLNRTALVAHRQEGRTREQERERIAHIETALERVQEQLDTLLRRLPVE
jgi:hypothetical protein